MIALDAMGGDLGAETVLTAAARALAHGVTAKFLLFGDEPQLRAHRARWPALAEASEIVHCPKHVPMDMPPAQAVRYGRKDSSMGMAIEAVRAGRADCVVSAGNTGALMALATLQLRTMPHIARPAIAGILPTDSGHAVMLDLGATISITAEQYVQFAVLGEVYANARLGIATPRIGLLNVGSEDMKGTEAIRRAAQMLENSPLNFRGFVEGNGILQGEVDVVVTDGFTGNVALKTAEGTAQFITRNLRIAMRSSLMAQLGGVLAARAFRRLREKITVPGGGILLGLNGIVVKCHGGADVRSFASGIEIAHQLSRAKLLEHIQTDMHSVAACLTEPPPSGGQTAQTEPSAAQTAQTASGGAPV